MHNLIEYISNIWINQPDTRASIVLCLIGSGAVLTWLTFCLYRLFFGRTRRDCDRINSELLQMMVKLQTDVFNHYRDMTEILMKQNERLTPNKDGNCTGTDRNNI